MILDRSKTSLASVLLDLELFGALSGLQLITTRKQKFSGLGLVLGVMINYVLKKI